MMPIRADRQKGRGGYGGWRNVSKHAVDVGGTLR